MSDKPETDPTKPEETTQPAESQESKPETKASSNLYGDEEEEETKVVLENKEQKSGEEDDALIYIHRAKVYRFRDGKWKERGAGYAKMLRSKENKIRMILRQEKTLKVAVNFYSKYSGL